MSRSAAVAATLVLTLSGAARAEIIVTALDEGSPPPETLGDYMMQAFPPDDRPLFEDVLDVSGPTGDVQFEPAREHRRIGSGWLVWGHGYTEGDVYYHWDGDVTLTLAPITGAFIVYASANASAEITATANDDTSLTQEAYWADPAVGWGFHATDDSELLSITLSSTWGGDYAVGQFLIAPVPEPATLWLLALGGIVALSGARPGNDCHSIGAKAANVAPGSSTPTGARAHRAK
jgi:hypothetical protein